MEWISVKDRLPEGEEVLGYHEFIDYSNKQQKSWYVYKVESGKLLQYVECCRGDWEEAKEITHWMPLPEKPKD